MFQAQANSLPSVKIIKQSTALPQKMFNFTSTAKSSAHRSTSLMNPSLAVTHHEHICICAGWRPKMPSKKLQDSPRFVQSVERRKSRTKSGLKNCSLVESPRSSNIGKDCDLQ